MKWRRSGPRSPKATTGRRSRPSWPGSTRWRKLTAPGRNRPDSALALPHAFVAAEVKELPIHAGDLVGAQLQRRLAQPLLALLRVDPFVRRLQGAQREAGPLAQVMGRDHDFRLQPLDDRVALAVAQDVLRAVDGQRQHVDRKSVV